mmetsp:Transcript_94709/g.203382  ORF Transcript_94709/g.203382 Transcript_94709/m.203382 type:complete len:213 (+) Transcript_94709:383-1021(+)
MMLAKARDFHSKGDVTPTRSYKDRAEMVLMFSRRGQREGMNLWQLSSIQPRSAFVTKTTLPQRFAPRNVRATLLAKRRSCASCAGLGTTVPSRRSPSLAIHVEGKRVSSQSRTMMVSPGKKAGKVFSPLTSRSPTTAISFSAAASCSAAPSTCSSISSSSSSLVTSRSDSSLTERSMGCAAASSNISSGSKRSGRKWVRPLEHLYRAAGLQA